MLGCVYLDRPSMAAAAAEGSKLNVPWLIVILRNLREEKGICRLVRSTHGRFRTPPLCSSTMIDQWIVVGREGGFVGYYNFQTQRLAHATLRESKKQQRDRSSRVESSRVVIYI
jgi:hypothetical protein